MTEINNRKCACGAPTSNRMQSKCSNCRRVHDRRRRRKATIERAWGTYFFRAKLESLDEVQSLLDECRELDITSMPDGVRRFYDRRVLELRAGEGMRPDHVRPRQRVEYYNLPPTRKQSRINALVKNIAPTLRAATRLLGEHQRGDPAGTRRPRAMAGGACSDRLREARGAR